MKHFVGREDVTGRLRAVLRGEACANGGSLSILSIEGPGGIGKTSFFDHVRDGTDLEARNYLVLRIGGSGDTRHSVHGAIKSLTLQAQSRHLPAKPPGAYFPHLTEALTVFEALLREAKDELGRLESRGSATVDTVMSVIDVAVGLGKPLNAMLPKTAEYLDFKKLGSHREDIDRALKTLTALKPGEPGFLAKLGLDDALMLRNALTQTPLSVFAQRLVQDLRAVLVGYESNSFFKPSMAKVEKVDRLLLVIDDYEAVKGPLERFLVDHLFPQLKTAAFETTAVIIGRDRLLDTASNDWDRQLGGALLDPISLNALSRDELAELARLNDVHEEAEHARAWRDTEGFPFFVQLWLEEAQSGGRSAMLLKRAYERTTRWMSDDERRWLAHALVLDDVNIRTFRSVLKDDDEARRAFAWFEGEASVRDPHGRTFKVREYLRSRLLDYLSLSDPDLHEQLLTLRASMAAAG